MSAPREGAWLPDGHGLDPRARELLAEHGGSVHLRLSHPDGRYPRTGCGDGLGQWWTGVSSEVTCPVCLEVVHVSSAPSMPLTYVYDPDPSAADASWEWAQSLEPGTRIPLRSADGELVGWATVGERVERDDPTEFFIGPLDGHVTDRNPAS